MARPAPALTLALGLAAQNAIFEATGLMCDIRWPNDLLLSGKKVAGILVQVADGKAVGGIGINVGHGAFPGELAGVATSLKLEKEIARDRPQKTMVCPTEIVIALVKAVDSFAGLEKEEVLRLFAQASSYARGRRVRVEQADGTIEGTTAGLDPSGFLIVRKDDGTDTLVLAGGVRAAGS